MKITFDIPDGTVCAFFDMVWRSKGLDSETMAMQSHAISTDELKDGSTIVIREKRSDD